MLRRLGRRGMPLVLHPDVWRDRKVVFPTTQSQEDDEPPVLILEGGAGRRAWIMFESDKSACRDAIEQASVSVATI